MPTRPAPTQREGPDEEAQEGAESEGTSVWSEDERLLARRAEEAQTPLPASEAASRRGRGSSSHGGSRGRAAGRGANSTAGYETPGADTAISAYLDIAEKWGLDASQLANQFVTTRDFVTSNIIGATTMEQLKLAVTSVDIEMSDELLGEIEAVHMRAPNVCP